MPNIFILCFYITTPEVGRHTDHIQEIISIIEIPEIVETIKDIKDQIIIITEVLVTTGITTIETEATVIIEAPAITNIIIIIIITDQTQDTMTEIIQDNNHLIQDNNHLIIITEVIIIIDKDTTVEIQIETIETITIDNVLIVTIKIIQITIAEIIEDTHPNENKITDIIQKNGELMDITIAKTE